MYLKWHPHKPSIFGPWSVSIYIEIWGNGVYLALGHLSLKVVTLYCFKLKYFCGFQGLEIRLIDKTILHKSDN